MQVIQLYEWHKAIKSLIATLAVSLVAIITRLI